MAAIRANPVIKDFYARLHQRGLHPKAPLTGCMRKLLVILNAMLRSKTYWRTPPRVHRISPSRTPVFNTVAAKELIGDRCALGHRRILAPPSRLLSDRWALADDLARVLILAQADEAEMPVCPGRLEDRSRVVERELEKDRKIVDMRGLWR
jgi:hypothetical protein